MADRPFADFDLRGHVGIRLVDANERDIGRVERQLGPLRAQLERQPDITVRFVDRLKTNGPLTFAGLGDAGFDGEHFYVLRGKGKSQGQALLPLADAGRPCEIVCERSLAAVPLLLAFINLSALAKGIVPVHASAFVHAGRGVLVAGWAKGGKSEVLLAFMAKGATYVGDEWVYLTPDGIMFGVPEPMRLWAWQLQQLDDLRRRVPTAERLVATWLDGVARSLDVLAEPARRVPPLSSMLRRGAPAIARQASVQVSPRRLFGSRAMAATAQLDRLVFVSSHAAAAIVTEPIDASEVVSRMVSSNAHERAHLEAYYRQFRFAYPERTNPLIEGAAELDGQLMSRAVAATPAVWLRHPYPVRIGKLFDQLGGHVTGGPTRAGPATSSVA